MSTFLVKRDVGRTEPFAALTGRPRAEMARECRRLHPLHTAELRAALSLFTLMLAAQTQQTA